MIEHYQLTAEDLDSLASGAGNSKTTRLLRSAQLSKGLLLLRMVYAGDPARFRVATEVLAAAQNKEPDLTAGILADPWLCVWAARSVRGQRDPGYLDAVAAVAAVHTGLDADVWTRVRSGRVCLPGLGAVTTRQRDGTAARVLVRSGRASVRLGGTEVEVPAATDVDGQDWTALPTISPTYDGCSLRMTLDALDPCRDCYGRLLADPPTAGDLAAWRGAFDDGWALLVRHRPAAAAHLEDVLRRVVPLAPTADGIDVSATSRDAFGAFATTRPRSAADLAVTMVHEYQHSILSALLDLVPLHEPSDGTLYHAPWRADLRPIGPLLQGTYAFSAVAETWSRLRASDFGGLAERQFTAAAEQVRTALMTLSASTELTRLGRRFVAGLRARHERMVV